MASLDQQRFQQWAKVEPEDVSSVAAANKIYKNGTNGCYCGWYTVYALFCGHEYNRRYEMLCPRRGKKGWDCGRSSGPTIIEGYVVNDECGKCSHRMTPENRRVQEENRAKRNAHREQALAQMNAQMVAQKQPSKKGWLW
ncbi:Hypothetical protein D9617_4g000680 [Elsinoe fawcettii]|nr:Hypothetical protein D9617_4g000680 [Elsinoe fawcettii]